MDQCRACTVGKDIHAIISVGSTVSRVIDTTMTHSPSTCILAFLTVLGFESGGILGFGNWLSDPKRWARVSDLGSDLRLFESRGRFDFGKNVKQSLNEPAEIASC